MQERNKDDTIKGERNITSEREGKEEKERKKQRKCRREAEKDAGREDERDICVGLQREL